MRSLIAIHHRRLLFYHGMIQSSSVQGSLLHGINESHKLIRAYVQIVHDPKASISSSDSPISSYDVHFCPPALPIT